MVLLAMVRYIFGDERGDELLAIGTITGELAPQQPAMLCSANFRTVIPALSLFSIVMLLLLIRAFSLRRSHLAATSTSRCPSCYS
jgi:hypothetical protein